MKPAPPPWNSVCPPSRLVVISACYGVLGGILTLLGWAIPSPRLTDWAEMGISMFPNAAVCGILCGVALLALSREKGPWGAPVWWRACAWSASAIGVLTLFEHGSGINLGIDELLFAGTWGQNASTAPNRMGLPASISFLFLGAGIAMSSGSERSRYFASGFTAVPIAIASLSVVGYWFGASQLFGIAQYTAISWQTASIILILGFGLVANLREYGLMAFLLRSDPGALVARRLVLPIVIVPLILGWFRIVGRDYGWFDDNFGTAVRSLLEIVLFLGFLWWATRSISRHASAASEALEALSLSEKRFARFMQSLPGLAWIKDTEGRYVYANETAMKVFQRPSDQLYGFTDADFLPGKTAEEFMANDRRALAEPAGLQIIETLLHGDGRLHSSLVSKFPITGQDDGPTFIGGIAIDITARLRAEEQLRQASRRKDEFIATLAHELRNPLSPIRFAVENCRRQTDGASKSEALDIVDRQVQQMSRLLEDLLDVSRISYGKLVLRPEAVDLSRILASAVETSQPMREEAGQSIHLDLPDSPVILHADPVRLEQIFGNLLNNAAKYGGRGTAVHLVATQEDSVIHISIRDEGIGIPHDRLLDIFERFSQVKPFTGGPLGGLGIGLSLVQGLVTLHGGRVEAHSDGLGQGSEFRVRLPLVPPPTGSGSGEITPTKIHDDLGGLRLLIADDLKDNADGLSSLFQILKGEVRTAYDGETALAEARVFRPHAIFLDIGMPGLGGHEVCRLIREESWGREVLLVAITGWGQESDRKRSRDAGFDHHLVKPVDVKELLSLVSSLRPQAETSPESKAP